MHAQGKRAEKPRKSLIFAKVGNQVTWRGKRSGSSGGSERNWRGKSLGLLVPTNR
jgi:hypothetical protein